MKNKKVRESNLELAKVVCMLMVIVLHYNLSTNLLLIPDGLNYNLGHFIESMAIIAVNTYVIITGYFSFEKTSVKVSKVVHLFFLSIFYGVTIFLVLLFNDRVAFTADTFAHLGEITFSRWFLVIYTILFLLIPFINRLIKDLNKKQFQTLIIIAVLFFNVWPSFFTNIPIRDRGYGIINFITLYMIGAYIAKYKNERIPLYQSLLTYIACVLLTAIMGPFMSQVYDYNHLLNLVKSVAFFEIFKSIKLKNNKVINYLSGYTFSTYIIHQNALLMPILYNDLFKAKEYLNSSKMILNMICTTFGIFMICIVLELIRRIILKPVDDKIDKIKFEIKCK